MLLKITFLRLACGEPVESVEGFYPEHFDSAQCHELVEWLVGGFYPEPACGELVESVKGLTRSESRYILK